MTTPQNLPDCQLGKEYMYHIPFRVEGSLDAVMTHVVWEITMVLIPWLEGFFKEKPLPNHPNVISFVKARALLEKRFDL